MTGTPPPLPARGTAETDLGSFAAPPAPLGERLRESARIAGVIGWLGICYPAWRVGQALTRRSGPRLARWNRWLVSRFFGGVLRILGVRVRREGNPPAPPFFLVSNHLSYIDVLVLGAETGGVFVAKHEMAAWPVFGHLSAIAGTLFIDRGRPRDALRMLESIDVAIADGAGVILFPEGTTSAGADVEPFFPALLEWAARREYPVQVASLSYETADPGRPAHEAVCWWGGMTLYPHFRELCRLRGIEAHLVLHGEPVRDRSRTQLAESLRTTMRNRFRPVAPPPRDAGCGPA